MALSQDTIPTIVAETLLEALRKRLVYQQLFNSDYAGEVSYGATVKIPSIGSVSVSDYSRYTDLSWQEVSDDSQTLSIDQQKSFSFVIDDIDAVQSRPEMMGAYVSEAAYRMADTIDQFLADRLATNGAIDVEDSGTTTAEITSADVKEYLVRMARELDDAMVPREGRVCVIPPWFSEKMLLSSIDLDTDNSQALTNGWVGRYAGFDVLLSHNVPNTSGSDFKIIAGTSRAATWARQIQSTEEIRLESYFGTGMRGLAVYGAKVTRPDTIAVLTANEAEET